VGPPALAAAHPRIVAPVAGTIVALDPDIPPARQRMVFEADARGAALRWVVDGADLGPAGEPLLWEPVRGRHAVGLVDATGQALDTVTFEVRGLAAAPR
jgi:penicillin-binding protein 1C